MPNYQDILQQALRLTPEEQLKLAVDILTHVQDKLTARPKHSIMELKGLGKELWQSVDVDQYLEEERNSWEG